MEHVRVFISYAWEDEGYRDWVKRLATTLRMHGVNARLDAWDLGRGQSLPAFMNAEIRLADHVLVLGSPQYRLKVHALEEQTATTGAGWEAMLLTSEIFNGHSDKVVVALTRGTRAESLPDFLRTQLIYDLTPPDEPKEYRDLLADLLGQRPKAPPLGDQPRLQPVEFTPLFETPSTMELTLELRPWINAHWPERKPDAIYPPWSEFEAGLVTFPADILDQVEELVAHTPCTMVIGSSGSGKSVLGASVAFRWSRATGGRAFWLDFGDHIALSPDELRRDMRTFFSLPGDNLLVLDNTHLASTTVDWAVTQIHSAHQLHPGRHRLLILARPLQTHSHQQASLHERLTDSSIGLTPRPGMFAAVATRLLARHTLVPDWTEADYERWSHEFGGDLIAFGQAVLAARGTGHPSKALAAKRVRETYIDPARRHPGGIDTLDRLCAAATLDFAPGDLALGDKVLQSVPHLIDMGQVQSFEQGPHRRWKMAHPGIGSLILATRARDIGQTEADLQLAALLALVRENLYVLGPLTTRITNRAYGTDETVESWSKALAGQPALLENLLSHVPTWAIRIDHLLPNLIPWHILRDNVKRAQLLESFRHLALADVVSIVRRAEQREPEPASALLDEWLDDPKFRGRLNLAAPGDLVSLFRYLDERKANAVQPLLTQLLRNRAFRAHLVETPSDDMVSFIRYVEQNDRQAAGDLLHELLGNDEFLSRLVHAPTDFVRGFVQYAEQREPSTAQSVLQKLLQDNTFTNGLLQAPPDSVAKFLRYAEQLDQGLCHGLLLELLDSDVFGRHLQRTAPDSVAAFFRYAEQRALEASKLLLQKLLSDDAFRSHLKNTSSALVISILRQAQAIDPAITQDLLHGLLEDPAFRTSLLWASPSNVVSFLRYAHKRDSAAANGMLQDLLNNERFRSHLRYVPLIELMRFLRYADERQRPNTQALLEHLLRDAAFRARLRYASPVGVVNLLRYTEHVEPVAAKSLLVELMQDSAFRVHLRHVEPVSVLNFLRFAEQRETGLSHMLLKELLEDDTFCAQLSHRPLSHVADFLRYAEQLQPSRVPALLTELLDTALRARLRSAQPVEVVSFLRHAKEHFAGAAQLLLRELLRDEEFRARLPHRSPEQIASLFQYSETHEPGLTSILLREFLLDDAFLGRLCYARFDDILSFLRYAEKREPQLAQALLHELLRNDRLRIRLRQTPEAVARRFLRYTDEHAPAQSRGLRHDLSG